MENFSCVAKHLTLNQAVNHMGQLTQKPPHTDPQANAYSVDDEGGRVKPCPASNRTHRGEYNRAMQSDEEFVADVNRHFARSAGGTLYPLLALFVVGIVKAFRSGLTTEALILLSGAIGSVVCIFFYGFISTERANGKPKALWMWPAAWGGMVPYLYSLYVVGVLGLSIKSLWSAFAWSGLWEALLFIVLGHWFLGKYYALTELMRRVDEVLDTREKGQRSGALPRDPTH